MKKVLRIVGNAVPVLLAALGIMVIGVVILFVIAVMQPAVKEGYYEKVKTDLPLEQKYTAKGEYEVSSVTFKSDNKKIEAFKVWYPAELEHTDHTYPLVVMANGTGVKASKYEAVFDHLASWGFIVIGNEDESSWDGASSAESLDWMLGQNGDSTSVFYGKIDPDHIGVAGHSQGGVGAINAVTAQDNGGYYKTIYTASTPHLVLAEALEWPYDVSKINIPYFMVAGTLKADAGDGVEGSSNVGIAPLFSLQDNYAAISDGVEKVMARRVGADHGDMLVYADGYMTAWMMYQLKGDADAAKVFVGEDAEILANTNWQDVAKNN